MTTPTPESIPAKQATIEAWRLSGRNTVSLDNWTVIRVADGSLLLSAQIDSPAAEEALKAFGKWQSSFLSDRIKPGSGDVLPAFDYSVPGRTAFVWRIDGVWVELWHDEPVVPAPRPTPALHAAQTARTAPSARLPFTRLRNALNLAKENRSA